MLLEAVRLRAGVDMEGFGPIGAGLLRLIGGQISHFGLSY
jgi:hypothetical protein